MSVGENCSVRGEQEGCSRQGELEQRTNSNQSPYGLKFPSCTVFSPELEQRENDGVCTVFDKWNRENMMGCTVTMEHREHDGVYTVSDI